MKARTIILVFCTALLFAAPAVHAAVGKNGLHCSLRSTMSTGKSQHASVKGCATKSSTAAAKGATSITTGGTSSPTPWSPSGTVAPPFGGVPDCPPYSVDGACDNGLDTTPSQSTQPQGAQVGNSTQAVAPAIEPGDYDLICELAGL
jgi:hypothetical protein